MNCLVIRQWINAGTPGAPIKEMPEDEIASFLKTDSDLVGMEATDPCACETRCVWELEELALEFLGGGS